MTTRQKLDVLLDRLSDPELEAEYARLLREREVDRRIIASYQSRQRSDAARLIPDAVLQVDLCA
jgi:uncharacterized protein involved in exopolysaccharide biosynthesis